jgi:hypothetical protein
MSESKTYSIMLRVRRVTVEDAYVAVPVTGSILIPDEEGTLRVNSDAFVAEAIRISGDPRVEWQIESTTTEPHPVQAAPPDGRRSFDAYYDDGGMIQADAAPNTLPRSSPGPADRRRH